MILETGLLLLGLEGAAYLFSLSWIAWVINRETGRDPFELAILYSLAALIAFLLPLAPPTLSIIIAAGITTATCVRILPTSVLLLGDRSESGIHTKGRSNLLLATLLGVAISLSVYDWLTQYRAIAFGFEVHALRTVSLIAVCLMAFLLLSLIWRHRYIRWLRLGTDGRWAFLYWDGPSPQRPFWLYGTLFASWTLVLVTPLASTGLQSTTVLRDTMIAVLLARVAGRRGISVLLLGSVLVAVLRTTVAYGIVGGIGPAIVEATIFTLLLFVVATRIDRSEWE